MTLRPSFYHSRIKLGLALLLTTLVAMPLRSESHSPPGRLFHPPRQNAKALEMSEQLSGNLIKRSDGIDPQWSRQETSPGQSRFRLERSGNASGGIAPPAAQARAARQP